MLTDEQLEMRRTGLTSSDMAALSGASPWASAHDVYTSKMTGAIVPCSEAMDLGNILEPVICDEAARRLNVLTTNGTTERHASATWMLATPDRNIIILPTTPQRVGLIEAKAVGVRTAFKWTEDTIPDYVTIQVAWQLAVTQLPMAYVAALIGTELRTYEVHRDVSLESALIELGDKFWRHHVLAGKPPTADGSESARRMLASVWPKENAGLVDAPTEAEDVAREYLRAHAAIKMETGRKERAQQRMCELLGASEGFLSPNFKATWKWQKASHVAAHTRAEQRVFRLTKKGDE